MNKRPLSDDDKARIWDAAVSLYGRPPLESFDLLVERITQTYRALFLDAETPEPPRAGPDTGL